MLKVLKKFQNEERLVLLQEYPNGQQVVTLYSKNETLSSQVYKSKYYASLAFTTFVGYPINIIKQRYAY